MKLYLRRRVSKIDFFFCFLTNSFFLCRGGIWQKVCLKPSVFVCYSPARFNSQLFILKFFNNSGQFWNLFWKIVALSKNSLFGFFAELELIGLGFRIKKITSTLYRFFWGHANYVYLFVPKAILVEYSHDERLIFFFSTDIMAVNQIVSYLLLLKKLSVYRITGFIRPGKIIRLNAGKQR